MVIICQADDSHEKSSFIFPKQIQQMIHLKYLIFSKKKNEKWMLFAQVCLML